MTGEELVQYFHTYCGHLKACEKHYTRSLSVYMANGYKQPECTCGLDPLLAELGLPSTPDQFTDEVLPGQKEGTELETMIDLPPGLRKKDRCPLCGKLNPVELFEKTDRGIVCRYQCICGNSHGIVHTGPMVKVYDKWIEMKKKEIEKKEDN